MSKVRTILAYFLAALAVPITIAFFVGMTPLAEALVKATGLKVSPWYDGGEVVRTIKHDGYATRIHRPVFDGLVGEKKEGFVRIDWVPSKELPPKIKEGIDINDDGKVDVVVNLDTSASKATINPKREWVEGLIGTYSLKDGQAVKIKLKNVGI